MLSYKAQHGHTSIEQSDMDLVRELKRQRAEEEQKRFVVVIE
jgi:hypothetical protein